MKVGEPNANVAPPEIFMQHKTLKFGKGFRVQFGNKRSQACEMVLAPGDAEGDPQNEHHGADQWLFVVDGKGVARINGRRLALRQGTLVLIEKGDKHEIKNTGRQLLRTLNIYVPPAYRKDGNPLPRGRRS
jgi:mannose-6-phosphate isomerase-like protein (cupin superfamily)